MNNLENKIIVSKKLPESENSGSLNLFIRLKGTVFLNKTNQKCDQLINEIISQFNGTPEFDSGFGKKTFDFTEEGLSQAVVFIEQY